MILLLLLLLNRSVDGRLNTACPDEILFAQHSDHIAFRGDEHVRLTSAQSETESDENMVESCYCPLYTSVGCVM